MLTVEVELTSAPELIATTERTLVVLDVRFTERLQSPPAVVEAVAELAPPVTMMVELASAVPLRMIGVVVVD